MNNLDKNSGVNKSVINYYPGHMAKTKRLIQENINFIDVVYEVIDARMPYSSKVKDLDNYIKNKPRIIIMTKIDLCDMVETKKWEQYYQDKGYYVFKTNLEKDTNFTKLIKMTQELMSEENQKRQTKGMINKKIRVLVVGIPNVGKSTLINKLVGKKVSNVGNKPGITKQLNWIRINKELELLDSPGILWPKLDNQEVALTLASLSAIKEEILPMDDVIYFIIKTLSKYYPNILMQRYKIESLDDDYENILNKIGQKRGCLIKGGLIDYDKVYNVILNDIKSGLIGGITFDHYGNE